MPWIAAWQRLAVGTPLCRHRELQVAPRSPQIHQSETDGICRQAERGLSVARVELSIRLETLRERSRQ